MLFNSYEFIFAFLPATLVGFFLLGRLSRGLAFSWLIVASVVYYAWWRPINVLIILPSIAVNYGLRATARAPARGRSCRATRDMGVGPWHCLQRRVPRLLQVHQFPRRRGQRPRGHAVRSDTDRAAARHLVHHVPEDRVPRGRPRWTGQGVLAARLRAVRPVLSAAHRRPDRPLPRGHAAVSAAVVPLRRLGCRGRHDPVRDRTVQEGGPCRRHRRARRPALRGAREPAAPVSFPAWFAAIGFTFQMYFDFSGYSDMALGIARCFGVRLPPNFDSPLKARSIIDFWLRWHMTLTRFLTAYLYNPLVMALTRRRMQRHRSVLSGRKFEPSAFIVLLALPTLFTMFMSGLWHGAGYLFIAWGLLHGVYLVINHAWREARRTGTIRSARLIRMVEALSLRDHAVRRLRSDGAVPFLRLDHGKLPAAWHGGTRRHRPAAIDARTPRAAARRAYHSCQARSYLRPSSRWSRCGLRSWGPSPCACRTRWS